MAQKYLDAKVSSLSKAVPKEFQEPLGILENKYNLLMDNVEFSQCLEAIFKFIGVMNKYIEDKKPWALRKENKEDEIKYFLYSLLEGIRLLALYLWPFIPYTSAAINRQLGLEASFDLKNAKWAGQDNFSIKKENPLFPRIDVD
jgi:methionyl-tRNA synthetase